MYYRENDQIVKKDNVENYEYGVENGISTKGIGLIVLYLILAICVLTPIIFTSTAKLILDNSTFNSFYVSIVLLLIILIIVLSCT